MKLETIEGSQLTALLSMWRPSGQLHLPTAVSALVDRYGFLGMPELSDLLEGDIYHFRHGSYETSAFDLSIYNDGLILKSASDTTFLERILHDLLEWATSSLGLARNEIPPRQTFFESSLVVAMEIEQKSPLLKKVLGQLAKYQEAYGLGEPKFDFAGISLAVDNLAYVGRKPAPFTLSRRVNVPFGSSIYHSNAPLKTSDHLALLTSIEKAMA
jgi:hypothetical protein